MLANYTNQKYNFTDLTKGKYDNKDDNCTDPMTIDTVTYYLKDLLDNFTIKATVAYLISIILFIHSHIHYSYYIMVTLAFLDLITGISRAVKYKSVSSYKAGKGVIKIVLYTVFVMCGVLADYGIFHKLPEWGFSYLITSYLIINLAISILENLDDLGCPVPRSLVSWLRKFRDKIDKDCDPPIRIVK